MSEKITIVVPVSVKDITRLECVLLPSINIFFDKNFLQEIILVHQDKIKTDCDELKERFDKLNIRCVHEKNLCEEPITVRWRRTGWHFQQILKLLVARFGQTEKYLLMDVDCLSINKINKDNLLPGGKSLMSFKNYTGYQSRWVRESRKLLKLSKVRPMMGITPQILYKNIVLDLLQYLEDLYKIQSGKVLANNKFTEYSLYWIYLCNFHDYREYYIEGNLFGSESLFKKSNIELDIVKIFNSDSLFAIIQSVRKNANKDILLLKTKLENLKNE